MLFLNHTIVTTIDRDLSTGGGVENGAGDLADHGGNAGRGNFGVEEVFCFVFFDGHSVALGRLFEGFVGPDFGVEDGIRMEDVDANAEFGQFEGCDTGELGHACLGDGVGGSTGPRGGVVSRTDDDDTGLLLALLKSRDGELQEPLGGGEVDAKVEVPRILWSIDVFAGFEDSSVGDDEVEAAVLGDDLVDSGLEGGVIRDVANGPGKAFTGEVSDDVGINIEADDGGSVVTKAFGSGAADSSAGSGDDGDFIGVDLFGHFRLGGKSVVEEGKVFDGVFVVEDGGTGNDEMRLHVCNLGDRVFAHAAINADEELGFPLEERFDFGGEVVEEEILA